MRNPWLEIPLSDYEGHMAMPGIAQAQMLGQILADVLGRYAPRSIAILGCAGGNGFGSISPSITKRVVGVDVNPHYVAAARARYEGRFQQLELHVADIQKNNVAIKPVDLVFAALILEYVDVDAAIAATRSLLVADGRLVTVVQLPSGSVGSVTPSPYASLQSLGPVMRLVLPDEVLRSAHANGYDRLESETVGSEGGKHFQVQIFTAKRSSGRT